MGSTQIAVVGPAGAGKTTLVQRLMGQSPTGTTPTIGFNVRKFNYRGVELLVTDLGGQQAFVNEFWEKMLSKADGIIFVMDAAAPNLFATAYDLFLFVLPRMNNVPMVVLANKQDLPHAATVEELSKLFDFKAASRRYGITALEIFPISALTGQGVKQAIDWLTNQIVLATGGELPTVTTVYVYQTQTGIPMAIAKDIFVEISSNTDDELVDLNKEPGLITAFYSALSAFAQEIIHANVQSLHLRNPNPTKPDYILFNCVDSDDGETGCLIVAKNDGNETLLEILAERIIDEVRHQGDQLRGEGQGQFLVDITNLVRKIARDFVKSKEIMDDDRETFEWARLLDKKLKSRGVPVPTSPDGQVPAITGSVKIETPKDIRTPPTAPDSSIGKAMSPVTQSSSPSNMTGTISTTANVKETVEVEPPRPSQEVELVSSQSRVESISGHHDDYEDDEYYRYFRRLSVAERVKEIERRRRQRSARR